MVLTFSGIGESSSGILCLIPITHHQVKRAFGLGEVQGLIPRMTKGMENLLHEGGAQRGCLV